jgi:hypothetical protein
LRSASDEKLNNINAATTGHLWQPSNFSLAALDFRALPSLAISVTASNGVDSTMGDLTVHNTLVRLSINNATTLTQRIATWFPEDVCVGLRHTFGDCPTTHGARIAFSFVDASPEPEARFVEEPHFSREGTA